MPKGYHDHAADLLKKLGLLTRVGSIDPNDDESLKQVHASLVKWVQAYRLAGDNRPLRVYIAHEPDKKTD